MLAALSLLFKYTFALREHMEVQPRYGLLLLLDCAVCTHRKRLLAVHAFWAFQQPIPIVKCILEVQKPCTLISNVHLTQRICISILWAPFLPPALTAFQCAVLVLLRAASKCMMRQRLLLHTPCSPSALLQPAAHIQHLMMSLLAGPADGSYQLHSQGGPACWISQGWCMTPKRCTPSL